MISDHVKIKRPGANPLEQYPMLQSVAPFIKPLTQITDPDSGMNVRKSERRTNFADEISNLLPLHFFHAPNFMQKIRIKISHQGRPRCFR